MFLVANFLTSLFISYSFLFGDYFLFGFNRMMDREVKTYQNTVSLQTWIHLLEIKELWQHGLTFPKLPFPIALRIWKWSKFTVREKEEQKLNITHNH